MMGEGYTIEELSTTMTVRVLVERFYRPQKVWMLCKACPNYGRKWGCPPFEYDVVEKILKYNYIELFATRVVFTAATLSPDEREAIMRTEYARIESQLLALERTTGGVASANIGGCERCKERGCTRPNGAPCRHPELLRASLEAYGFDVPDLLYSAFGINLTPASHSSELVLLTALLYS